MTDSLAALRSPAAWMRFVLTAVIGLAVDQITKIYAFARLTTSGVIDSQGHYRPESREFVFIQNWIHFRVTSNYGAVFGLGQGWRHAFVVYLFATSGRQRIYQIVLGMLVAGVLGNLYDRMTLGYVRDMIYALPKWGYFPWIFNVADTLLCTGVAAMILYSFLHPPAKARNNEPKEPAST
ncbi:MAG TPA: signal peptidase II [Humisphaera sp.]|jgi:lipoprotein signal peptidase|nr:signal peptidase II [Humisphaera sp.]